MHRFIQTYLQKLYEKGKVMTKQETYQINVVKAKYPTIENKFVVNFVIITIIIILTLSFDWRIEKQNPGENTVPPKQVFTKTYLSMGKFVVGNSESLGQIIAKLGVYEKSVEKTVEFHRANAKLCFYSLITYRVE